MNTKAVRKSAKCANSSTAGKKTGTAEASVVFQKISAVYIGVMFSVFPLWFDSTGFGGITEAKYYFFRNVSLVYLAAVLLVGLELLFVGAVAPREIAAGLRHPGWIRICMLGYVIFCAISALRSPYGKSTWIGMGRYEGLSTILLYVAVFLCISYFARFKEWMAGIAGAAMTAMACLCLVQFTGANPFGIYPGEYHYDSVFLGTIGNIDMIGTIFSILLPLFLAGIAMWEDRRRYLLLIALFLCSIIWFAIRVDAALLAVAAVSVLLIPVACLTAKRLSDLLIGYAAMAAGCAFCELFTLDRANEFGYSQVNPGTGFAVLLTVAVLCLVLSVPVRKKFPEKRIHPKRVRIVFFTIILVMAAAAVIWLKWFCPSTEGTLYELSCLLNGDLNVSFGNNRLLIWSETLKLVREYPLFGAGPDTLGARLTVDVVLDPTVSTEVETAIVDNAHNEYLNILVNTGLLSLISYAAGLIALAVFWLKRALQEPDTAVTGAAAAGYCIQAFFSFSITMTTPLFWIMLGLLCALADAESPARDRKVQIPQQSGDPQRQRRLPRDRAGRARIHPAYAGVKRLLDILVSFIGNVILLPLQLLIAAVVHFDSPGGVLFRQRRAGKDGRIFTIFKFRTMKQGTPEVDDRLLDNPEQYVTRSGGFLRRTHLDELPQLFNILKGDMSLVGPRPVLWNQSDLLMLRDTYGANRVRPGLTGWAQIQSVSDLTAEEKAHYDGYYVEHMGIWMDLKCVLLTPWVICRGKGLQNR